MFDSQDDVKGLNQGALCIATTRVFMVVLISVSILVQNAIWKTRLFHISRSCKEGTDSEIENIRITFLIHPSKQLTKIVYVLSKRKKRVHNRRTVAFPSSGHGFKHRRDALGTTSFDGYGNKIEPLFVPCPSKRGDGPQIGEIFKGLAL